MEVTLIDHMGDDLTVVNAARVSMAKESEWEYTAVHSEPDRFGLTYRTTRQHLSDKDAKLISYLAIHDHWTPFAHCQITMREKVPIFVARQRFKHTVGFVYNEVSRRYVDEVPEFYVPKVWRKRADNVKQGSSDAEVFCYDTLHEGGIFTTTPQAEYKELIELAEKVYAEMIAGGVCPEQARMVLPQSMFTEYYVTGSLAAWARAYKLRTDNHAQKEIRCLAELWDAVIAPLYPESWKWLTL